jgi:hypothetical protein
MKTNYLLAIAMIFLSIFASNAFGVLRSPYPGKPYPPDHIIVIGEEEQDRVRTTLRKTETNRLVADQAAAGTHEVINFKSEKQTQKRKKI